MTDRQKTSRVKLLAALLAALILCTLLSMPALAQGAGAEDTGESSSFVESMPDSSLIESENESSEPEESAVEEALDAKDGEEEPEEQARASAAGAGLLDALPVQVSDYSEFDAALSQIILDGSGHIELLDDITFPDTVVIPGGVSLTISGSTGTETIDMDIGVDNTRHLWVEGTLELSNVILDGEGRTGGVVVYEGHIELLSGAQIIQCYHETNPTNAISLGIDAYFGGGLHLLEATGTMYEGASIMHNQAVNYTNNIWAGGGGIAVSGRNARFVMEGGLLYRNYSGESDSTSYSNYGGAVFLAYGYFEMRDGQMVQNGARMNGGAVYCVQYYGETDYLFDMSGGEMIANYGNGAGAIYTYEDCHIRINGGIFTGNYAYQYGGAIYLGGGGTMHIENANFTQNEGRSTSRDTAGAIMLASDTVCTIENTVFNSNTATRMAGAINSYSTDLTISNSQFINNSAELEGGAIYLYPAQNRYEGTRVINTLFANNRSDLGPYEFGTSATDASWTKTFEQLHAANINVTGLSSPFDHTWAAEPRYNKAYNNFDISYPGGAPFSPHEVQFIVEGVGHVGSEFALDGQPVPEYTAYTPPTGQVVDGWYTDTTYTTKWVFSDVVSGNMELYGRLTPAPSTNHTLTVQYYFGLTLAAAVYIDEVDFAIPDGDDPALHLPSGWLDAHRPATGYAAGILADPLVLPGSITDDETFQVLYQPHEYHVTFDYSQVFDAPGNTLLVPVYYNELVPAQNTAQSGYTFKGWWYTAENRYWSLAQDRMPADDITLVGHWTKNTTPPITPSESSTSTGGGGESSNPPTTSSSTAPSTSRPASSSSTPASTSLASSSGPSSSAVSEPVASPGPDDELDNRNIGGTDLPLDWWQRGDGWSLLNLLVSILLLLSAAFQLVRLALAKNRREDEYGQESVRKQRRLWTVLCAVSGIVPILLLFLLEDFSGAMMLLDKWSPWFIGFALLHAAFTVVALTRKSKWAETH